LLNRYRVVKPYRGFESLRLRHIYRGIFSIRTSLRIDGARRALLLIRAGLRTLGPGLHVRRRTALGTGGRGAAAPGGEWASSTLRLRLPFVTVRGGSAPVDGLRGAQSIQVELGLGTCHRGVSGDAGRGEHKAHVRSSRQVDVSQPGARALVPQGAGCAPAGSRNGSVKTRRLAPATATGTAYRGVIPCGTWRCSGESRS
jgi:hypothetical protein